MGEYSKKVKSELVRLKKASFKQAQDLELEALAKEFDKWRKKRIGADRLEEAIAKHQSFRREQMESQYQEDGDPGVPVAEALVKGYLKESDLSPEAYSAIGILIDLIGV